MTHEEKAHEWLAEHAPAWSELQGPLWELLDEVCDSAEKERDELHRVATALLRAWGMSPEGAADGLEASFYDHLDELRELVEPRTATASLNQEESKT